MLPLLLLQAAVVFGPELCFKDGILAPCERPEFSLCWDENHKRWDACSHVRKHQDSRAERVFLGLAGKGIDLYTTALVISAGGHELNPIQPTVEHRVGIALVELAIVFGTEELLVKMDKPKLARWFGRIVFLTRVAVGVWNLGQATKARR